MILVIIKFIALLVAVFFTLLNTYFVIKKESVPASNFIVQAISVAIFVFIQGKMWL